MDDMRRQVHGAGNAIGLRSIHLSWLWSYGWSLPASVVAWTVVYVKREAGLPSSQALVTLYSQA